MKNYSFFLLLLTFLFFRTHTVHAQTYGLHPYIINASIIDNGTNDPKITFTITNAVPSLGGYTFDGHDVLNCDNNFWRNSAPENQTYCNMYAGTQQDRFYYENGLTPGTYTTSLNLPTGNYTLFVWGDNASPPPDYYYHPDMVAPGYNITVTETPPEGDNWFTDSTLGQETLNTTETIKDSVISNLVTAVPVAGGVIGGGGLLFYVIKKFREVTHM